MADIESVLVPPNVLAERECEFALNVKPLDFVSYATQRLNIEQLRIVFSDMGIHLPTTIANRWHFDRAIDEYPRMTNEQILDFDARILRFVRT